ncbi:MAG: hypothetical protein WC552_06060 [Candidatus Omnitrophota bacterium]
MEDKKRKAVVITQYKRAGRLGPFQIKSKCAECDLNTHHLKRLIDVHFREESVELEIKPWLDHFFFCLLRGALHPPIIMVNGKVFFQFTPRHPLFEQGRLITLVNRLLGGNRTRSPIL